MWTRAGIRDSGNNECPGGIVKEACDLDISISGTLQCLEKSYDERGAAAAEVVNGGVGAIGVELLDDKSRLGAYIEQHAGHGVIGDSCLDTGVVEGDASGAVQT